VLSVLLVAWLMTPAIVNLVATRRFPALERKRGAGIASSIFWSLACTVLALLALVISIPLWFIPPLVLVVPPLIWGWLTYRVMSFDVLAAHASTEERRTLMRQHRAQLLGIGVVSGYLGAAPSWSRQCATLVFAPLIPPRSGCTLVFAFSAWFALALAACRRSARASSITSAPPSPRPRCRRQPPAAAPA
jgi:hypothetical protein